jgi:hypothetical protein
MANTQTQSTWRIIDGLRNISKQMDAVLRRDLIDAAARLQEQAELIEKMRAEMVNPDDLSQQMLKLIAGMNEAKAAQVRPEPSRLEIAAMIFAGGTEQTITDAFLAAEELIEHARKTE